MTYHSALDCYADEQCIRVCYIQRDSVMWNLSLVKTWLELRLSGDLSTTVIVLMMITRNRQLTDSDLNHTGKAEDSPCSQRSNGSWRVGGTWRARWPWAPAHWKVGVREKQRDLWCTALSSLSTSLSPSSCRLLAASPSPNYKFSSLKKKTTLLAHYHSSHFNSLKTFCLTFNSLWVSSYPSTLSHIKSHSSILQHCYII